MLYSPSWTRTQSRTSVGLVRIVQRFRICLIRSTIARADNDRPRNFGSTDQPTTRYIRLMAETTAGPAGCLLKGVAVAGAILGIVTGIIKVTEYIKSPTSGVVAQVSLSPFELPQSVLEFRKKVEDAADFAAIEKSLNLPSGDAMQKALIAHSVATYLRNVLPGYGTQSISDARSLWFAEVKNVGTTTCQSTTITLPGADAVKMRRKGKRSVISEWQRLLNLVTSNHRRL